MSDKLAPRYNQSKNWYNLPKYWWALNLNLEEDCWGEKNRYFWLNSYLFNKRRNQLKMKYIP